MRHFRAAHALDIIQRCHITATAIGGLMGAAISTMADPAIFDTRCLRVVSHGGSALPSTLACSLWSALPQCTYMDDYGY